MIGGHTQQKQDSFPAPKTHLKSHLKITHKKLWAPQLLVLFCTPAGNLDFSSCRSKSASFFTLEGIWLGLDRLGGESEILVSTTRKVGVFFSCFYSFFFPNYVYA